MCMHVVNGCKFNLDMRNIAIIVLTLISMSAYSQEIGSFEDYKKQENQKFNKYVQKYKNDIEEMKRVEDEWDNITIDKVVKPKKVKPVSKERVKKLKTQKSIGVGKLNEKSLEKGISLKKRDVPESSYKDDAIKDKSVKPEVFVKSGKPYGLPLPQGKYRVSSSFGTRIHPIFRIRKHHTGIDLACKRGTPINVPSGGVVVRAGWARGYGKYIVVDHGDGYKTAYAHLSRYKVRKGDKVKPDQVIGYVGNTGYSTGPHLHYEVIKNNVKVDPAKYMKRN